MTTQLGQLRPKVYPWNKGLKGVQAGKNAPRWKGGKPNCAVCNKQLSKRGYKYCSIHKPFTQLLSPKIAKANLKRFKTNNPGFKKGHKPWNDNIHNYWLAGENHHFWKGDKVSYRALHSWVQRRLGKPDICSRCGRTGLKGKQIHWANKSGNYNRVVTDWIRLCTPCHSRYDGRSKKDY